MSEKTERRSLTEGSSLTRLLDGHSLSRQDILDSEPLIILVHGFTAYGARLDLLGRRLLRWSNEDKGLKSPVVAIYDYNSYRGISAAAITLQERLHAYCSPFEGGSERSILAKKIILISHSMGGLVARQFALTAPSYVRGIVMFGVPNDGVNTDALLDLMITVAENLDDMPLPYMRKKSNLARLQLTKKDRCSGEPLLDILARDWARMVNRPPTLTISGGKPRIEISGIKALDSALNANIQRLMRGETNDGLVRELSVNMNGTIFSENSPEYTHFNEYSEYADINHSSLVDNEGLARIAYNWMSRGFRLSCG